MCGGCRHHYGTSAEDSLLVNFSNLHHFKAVIRRLYSAVQKVDPNLVIFIWCWAVSFMNCYSLAMHGFRSCVGGFLFFFQAPSPDHTPIDRHTCVRIYCDLETEYS